MSSMTLRNLPAFLKKSIQNHFKLFLLILLLTTIDVCLYAWHAHVAKRITGSTACIDLVKQIEGKNFDGVYKLNCKLSPRTITNSSLTAHYLEYAGQPKDDSVCMDPAATVPPTPGSQYCVYFGGIITSDGHRYPGIGDDGPQYPPSSYDYCYGGDSHTSSLPNPTTRDLYFYQGDLYNRSVFKDVSYRTPYGTCKLNGTTLTHPAKLADPTYISDVKVAYEGFPKDCFTVTIGKSIDDQFSCVYYVTAANASLYPDCHTTKDPVVVKDKIVSYRDIGYSMIQNGCEEVYAQRMAALHQCDAIKDEKLRTSCYPLVDHPGYAVTRVSEIR